MQKHKVEERNLNVKMDSEEGDGQQNVCLRSSEPDASQELLHDQISITSDGKAKEAFNTYGLNIEFLESLGIDGPLNTKVFISNLDYKVTEKKLEEVFKIAGKLVKVELNIGEKGHRIRHGAVVYEHPLAAVQAISMFNQQVLYNQIITVQMNKFVEENDSVPTTLPSGLSGIGKGLGINGQPLQFSSPNTLGGLIGIGKGLGINGQPMQVDKTLTDATTCKDFGLFMGIGREEIVTSVSSNNVDCVICLQTLVQPVQLPCNHIFCYLCVKGVTHQNQKCAICREDIPADYLQNPNLVAVPDTNLTFEGKYQWFYEGKNGWWQYDDRTGTEIETAYSERQRQCELMIAGYLYIIDFGSMRQFRKENPNCRRCIKRDLVSIYKKGVAGIPSYMKTISLEANRAQIQDVHDKDIINLTDDDEETE